MDLEISSNRTLGLGPFLALISLALVPAIANAASFTPLGDLSGGDVFSVAWAVSADGSRVVGESLGARGTEAFIRDATHGMRELDVVLSLSGIDLDGWTLSRALSISADGRLIVGVGTNPSEFTEAWIAVIPEPRGVLLLGLGLAGLGASRGRYRASRP